MVSARRIASDTSKSIGKSVDTIQQQQIFTLAIIIIISYLFLFGFSHVAEIMTPGEDTYMGIKELTNTLGAVFLVIIGFYFGKAPTAQLQKKAEESQRDVAKKEAALEESMERISQLEDRLAESTRVIEMVKPLTDEE